MHNQNQWAMAVFNNQNERFENLTEWYGGKKIKGSKTIKAQLTLTWQGIPSDKRHHDSRPNTEDVYFGSSLVSDQKKYQFMATKHGEYCPFFRLS